MGWDVTELVRTAVPLDSCDRMTGPDHRNWRTADRVAYAGSYRSLSTPARRTVTIVDSSKLLCWSVMWCVSTRMAGCSSHDLLAVLETGRRGRRGWRPNSRLTRSRSPNAVTLCRPTATSAAFRPTCSVSPRMAERICRHTSAGALASLHCRVEFGGVVRFDPAVDACRSTIVATERHCTRSPDRSAIDV